MAVIQDTRDLALLNALIKDSNAGNAELGHVSRIPVNKVGSHIQKLRDMNVLLNHTVDLNYKELGFRTTVIYIIKMANNDPEDRQHLLDKLNEHKNVVSIWHALSQAADYIIKIMCRDLEEFSDIITEINSNKNVDSSSYTITIAKTLKDDRGPILSDVST